MNSKPYSDAYVRHLTRGPFPGRVDPWAEDAHYFQQIHSGMIATLMDYMMPLLLKMGYFASSEASLQIAASRKPDITVVRSSSVNPERQPLDYRAVAASVLAEPGIAIRMNEPELEAIYIRSSDSSELVTVLEIISPRNKSHNVDMLRYQEERDSLFLERGVNVVEIDPTRSVKRLIEHEVTVHASYHVAVFIPGEFVYILASELDEPLKRCALPLRNEALAVEFQEAYDFAFQQRGIAAQIDYKDHYDEAALPFPSLLTDAQREAALETVREWRKTLEQLKEA